MNWFCYRSLYWVAQVYLEDWKWRCLYRTQYERPNIFAGEQIFSLAPMGADGIHYGQN